jgi:hypothetical protein
MSQEKPLLLECEEKIKIPFPYAYRNYSTLIMTMSEEIPIEAIYGNGGGGGEDDDEKARTIPLQNIPAARLNKFIEFCRVMANIDETPEKKAAVVEARRARQVANQAKDAVKRANFELRNAEATAATAAASAVPSAAAGGGGSSAAAAVPSAAARDRVTRKAEEASAAKVVEAATEATAKAAENAASPVKVISSGNLADQFANLDARYRALLATLIQPAAAAGGGAGAINGDLLADMIQDMNFLDCKPLLNLFCGFFCLNFLNGKTATQVRTEWGIVNDFTPAEEAAIAAEEAWLNQ